MVFEGAIDKLVKTCSIYTHGGQACGQSQARIHVFDGSGNVGGADQPHGMGHFLQSLFALHRLGLCIELHHGWQEHGIQCAVVQAGFNSAQTVAHAVNTAQAFLECHRSLHAGTHELATCFGILPIAGRTLDMRPASAQTIQCNSVSGWVEHGGHKRFHAMRYGIHASGSSQHRREPIRELRVANGSLGHQIPGVKTQFALVINDDDGASCHLAASAAGGGHGNDGGNRLGDLGRTSFNRGVGFQRARVGGCDGDPFGAVNGAATTDSNQAVAVALQIKLRSSTNCSFRGIAGSGIKHRNGEIAQGIQRFLQYTRSFDTSVGYHHGAGYAYTLTLLGQQAYGTVVKLYLRDVIDKSHNRLQALRGSNAGIFANCSRIGYLENPEKRLNHVTHGTSHWPAIGLLLLHDVQLCDCCLRAVTEELELNHPLNPAMRDVLRRMVRANRPHLHTLTPQQARAAYEAGAGVLEIAKQELPRVEDIQIPSRDGASLSARLYAPSTATALPVLLYLHGGGFTIGSVATHDVLCRRLAYLAGCAVVSLDYRLAPENKFPTAIHDAWDALQWLHTQGKALGLDTTRMAVGGDSAGGTLAAACALQARDAKLPLQLQLLIYPGTCAHQDTDSHFRYAQGLVLEREGIHWFFNNYIRNEGDREDWRFAPLLATDAEGVAPAFFCLAELDPLVDEGVQYADMLRMAGVPVELEIYKGVTHEFIKMGRAIAEARQAHTDMAAALRAALGTSPASV